MKQVTWSTEFENGYMNVEDVLRYLKINVLALRQFTIKGEPNHFFNCGDLKKKIGASQFRLMECEVTTYLIIPTVKPSPQFDR